MKAESSSYELAYQNWIKLINALQFMERKLERFRDVIHIRLFFGYTYASIPWEILTATFMKGTLQEMTMKMMVELVKTMWPNAMLNRCNENAKMSAGKNDDIFMETHWNENYTTFTAELCFF